jgi:hypothetical protein
MYKGQRINFVPGVAWVKGESNDQLIVALDYTDPDGQTVRIRVEKDAFLDVKTPTTQNQGHPSILQAGYYRITSIRSAPDGKIWIWAYKTQILLNELVDYLSWGQATIEMISGLTAEDLL